MLNKCGAAREDCNLWLYCSGGQQWCVALLLQKPMVSSWPEVENPLLAGALGTFIQILGAAGTSTKVGCRGSPAMVEHQ